MTAGTDPTSAGSQVARTGSDVLGGKRTGGLLADTDRPSSRDFDLGEAPMTAGTDPTAAGSQDCFDTFKYIDIDMENQHASELTRRQGDAEEVALALHSGLSTALGFVDVSPAYKVTPVASPPSTAGNRQASRVVSWDRDSAPTSENFCDPARVEEISQSIHAIFDEHAPHKKAGVAALMKKHSGKEELCQWM